MVDEIVLSVMQVFRMVAEAKGITIEQGECEHLNVFADIDMCKTVLRNFLSNAIKFSTEGKKIIVSVKKENDKFARISVRDFGCGISEEDQAKLFHTATHFSKYGTNNEEGSGLGLLLCQDFAIKNGGNVYLESVLGEAGRFHIVS